MSLDLDLEQIPAAPGGVVHQLTEEQETSPLLERLRGRYEKVKQDKTEDFDVPGFGGLLVARYRKLDGDDMKTIVADPDIDGLLAYNVAVLVEATVEVFGRENGELRPLNPDHPVGYDAELAAILGIEGAESSREVLIRVFDGHDLTILDHGDTVNRWMVHGKDEPDLGK